MGWLSQLLPASLLLATACFVCAEERAAPFLEEFGPDWESRWAHSTDGKYTGRFEVAHIVDDPALKVPEKALHYGMASVLKTPVDPVVGLVLQYEAKWASGHTCSGGYLKYFTYDPKFSAGDLVDNTPYTIMFGPDKCGSGTNKVHFIMRHKSPLNGTIEEKHLQNAPKVPSDSLTHVYTAVLKHDNTFQILVDGVEEASGSLFGNFEPPFNPPDQIDDPEDKKPDDWVDNPKMEDPEAKKPEDWVDEKMIEDEEATKPDGWLDDEPVMVPDPDAEQPDEWDEEEDGVWEAPLIRNPKCADAPGCGEWKRPKKKNPGYKGEWYPPMIDNPDYKGPWAPRKIPNPYFYVDNEPLKAIGKIGAVGIEIWTMDDDILFDNIVIAQDEEVAASYRSKWAERHAVEEKEQEEKRREQAVKQGAAGFLQGLLDKPQLKFLRPYLQPVVELAETNTLLFYSLALTTTLAPIVSLMACCYRTSKEKADPVGAAKKEDTTGPDDAPGEDDGKDDTDGKVETVEDRSKKATAKEDDDDDDEEEEPTKPRQRTKRVA